VNRRVKSVGWTRGEQQKIVLRSSGIVVTQRERERGRGRELKGKGEASASGRCSVREVCHVSSLNGNGESKPWGKPCPVNGDN